MAIEVRARAGQGFRAAQFWPDVYPWPEHVIAGYWLTLHDGTYEAIQPGHWIVATPTGRWYAVDQELFDLLFEPVNDDD